MTAPAANQAAATDSLADFEPQCCITVLPIVPGPAPLRCEDPAKWTGFTPCCGVAALICEHHRYRHGPFGCPCGKQSEDLIGWARL